MILKTSKFKIASVLVGVLLLFSVLLQSLFIAGRVLAAEEIDISGISGLQFQLDAQDIADKSDGDQIASVENGASDVTLSGVGNAVQNDSSRQPTYAEESTINGLPAVRFAENSYLQIGADTGFYLEDMTIFVVANLSSIGSSQTHQIVSRLAAGDPWNHNWYFNIENGQFNYGWYTGTGHAQNKVTVSTGQSYVLSGRKDDSSGSMYINGSQAAVFTGGGPDSQDLTTPVTIGGLDCSMIGDVGEILIFDRGLTDEEMITVERYLENKWGMEDIHAGQLADLQINGETLTGFRSDKYSYSYLSQDALTKEDITATAWTSSDQVTVNETESGFEIEVKNQEVTRTYTVETDTMNYDYNEIQQLTANEVELNDGFWGDRYKQYSVYTVNYMFDMFDLSNSFDNFDRVANGEKKILNNTSSHAGQIRRPDNDLDVYNTTWTWIEEPWREGLIYEGIRAASEFLMINSSDSSYKHDVAELATRLDGYVDRIYAAALQTTWDDSNGKPVDGYFSTYNILAQTKVIDESDVSARFHHDVYNFGCLTEAAVYYYNATGDTRLLFAATRFAEFLVDYINGRDGFEGYKVVPAHELPEEALQSLYDLYMNNPELVQQMEEQYSHVEGLDPTDRYYELDIRLDEYKTIVTSWITDRGNSEGRYNETNYGSYAQDNVTYDEMTEAQGHAVRANLWYSAIAAVGNRQENFSFVQAAYNIWNNIVDSQMYVTGGTGSTNDGEEAYGGTNQLPHNGYCETCASVGMSFFSQNMFYLFGDAKYADNVELEMYNGILGCLGLEGNSFYYRNPMVSEDYTRPMLSNATPCCIPMFLKYYSELPEIIYAKTDSILFVNQYIASSAQTKVGETSVSIVQDTDMPNGDSAIFSVTTSGTFTLKLRVPSWTSGVTLTVNGQEVSAEAGEDGYIDVEITSGNTLIEIVFDKEVIRLYQDYAEENVGMVAFKYGPFVYCAEEIDNTVNGVNILANNAVSVAEDADVAIVYDDTTFELVLADGSTLPVGYNKLIVSATAGGNAVELTLIPFYLRGNRTISSNISDRGEMDVWFTES